MRIIDCIDRAARILSAVLLALMTLLVLIDVFWRYVLSDPLGEPSELSIMCMVWATMLGAATVFRTKSHIAVTLLVDLMPPALRRCAVFFSYAVMLIVLYLLVVHGWTVVLRGMYQMSTITGIPHGYVALSIPVGGALGALYILEQIWTELRGGAQNPRSPEEAPHA